MNHELKKPRTTVYKSHPAMKKLPFGIQSIKQIIEQDKVYVDKTGFALDLIEDSKHYSISRPKGFGKSLFLSTLKEIFKGNRDLFKGLIIDQNSDRKVSYCHPAFPKK